MATVPEHLRAGVTAELDALVGGERPELMTWVRQYGQSGTTLVDQPDEIWSHTQTEVVKRSDGGWHIVLPLWTVDESPSDLSADIIVTSDGRARLADVHVV